MAITIDDFDKVWASASPLTPYEFSESQYKEGWNFIGGTPPSRQMWDFLQKNNDEKMQYLADNYLPLSGGTMTGNITLAGGGNPLSTVGGTMAGDITYDNSGVYGIALHQKYEDAAIRLSGGTTDDSANLWLFGKNSTGAGRFDLVASDGSNYKILRGLANGTLTWNGQPVQTSSDKRLKQDFSDVPAEVLEAWSKVEWKQFKYKADAERKGDSCRWHTGLVAQDVQEVCGDEILKYGILCHDVQEATEEQEAVDLWTVRYTEALCMEVIYLRNEIKKLHEEIKALKTE